MSFSSDKPSLLNQLPLSVDFPKEFPKFLETMSLLYKRIADSVNTKEGSLYSLEELGNFQLFFTLSDPQQFRNVYRKVFDMVSINGGNIAAGATVTAAHGISGITACTHIYGTATNSDAPVRYMPLPYASATATRNIEIYLTPTNVVLINGATQTALTQAYIIAEFVKN